MAIMRTQQKSYTATKNAGSLLSISLAARLFFLWVLDFFSLRLSIVASPERPCVLNAWLSYWPMSFHPLLLVSQVHVGIALCLFWCEDHTKEGRSRQSDSASEMLRIILMVTHRDPHTYILNIYQNFWKKKLDFYHSDYCLHIYYYIHNVLADMSSRFAYTKLWAMFFI